MSKIEVRAVIHTPQLPNYLKVVDCTMIDVADITNEGLRDIAREWGEEPVLHAQKRRDNRIKK